jgi:hypothetical protein
MKITKTAKLKIHNRTFSLQPTLDIYSQALEYILCVVKNEKVVLDTLNIINKQ